MTHDLFPMLQLTIPNFGDLELHHLVLDYNGTLALDGKLLPGASEVLIALAANLEIHVVTADTFGLAAAELAGLPVSLTILSSVSQTEAKLSFIEKLGTSSTVAIGNGRNDRKMLEAAAIGIAVIQKEGAAVAALVAADIIATSVWDAFELLRHPKRLLATLRS
jgi:soluble P-type ATPase